QAAQLAACRREEAGLTGLQASGSVEDLARFKQAMTCDGLRDRVTAALDAAQKKAAQLAACRSEEDRLTRLQAGGSVEDLTRFGQTLSRETLRGRVTAALAAAQKKADQLAACRSEEDKFTRLQAGSSVEDITRFGQAVTCDSLRPKIAAALDAAQ